MTARLTAQCHSTAGGGRVKKAREVELCQCYKTHISKCAFHRNSTAEHVLLMTFTRFLLCKYPTKPCQIHSELACTAGFFHSRHLAFSLIVGIDGTNAFLQLDFLIITIFSASKTMHNVSNRKCHISVDGLESFDRS